MILLITPSAKAQECIPALQEATSEGAHAANSFRQAATLLRAQEYSAVVFDQGLLDAEPGESEVMLQHIGTAIPVYINFAITGTQRMVRELRSALQRRPQSRGHRDAASRGGIVSQRFERQRYRHAVVV